MVLTTKEEEIIKLIVNKTVLEMELESSRDVENSSTRDLQNLIIDSRASLKSKCIEK